MFNQMFILFLVIFASLVDWSFQSFMLNEYLLYIMSASVFTSDFVNQSVT